MRKPVIRTADLYDHMRSPFDRDATTVRRSGVRTSAARPTGRTELDNTRRNRKAIGETCKATAEGRTRLLYG